MKKSSKLAAFALVICILFSFASLTACSCGKTEPEDQQIDINGKEGTWNKLSVFVPEGMDLVGGSALDPSDPNTVWIQKRGDELSYFLVNIVSKETAEATIKTTKELNSAEDIELEANGIAWKGVKYKYAGVSDCFQVFGTVSGKTVLVSGSRFAVDSQQAKAVLGSIKIAD